MITGRQIREARALLGLQRSVLAARSKIITTATITRAEAVDGEPPITTVQAAAIQQVLERAGVDFTSDTVGPAGVKLRKADSEDRKL